MALNQVHKTAASRTRAGAPGIKARAMTHGFAPAGASLALTKQPTTPRPTV